MKIRFLALIIKPYICLFKELFHALYHKTTIINLGEASTIIIPPPTYHHNGDDHWYNVQMEIVPRVLWPSYLRDEALGTGFSFTSLPNSYWKVLKKETISGVTWVVRWIPHNPHSHQIWASLNKTHSCCEEGIWGSSLSSPLSYHLFPAGAAPLIPWASSLISQPAFPSRKKITTGLWAILKSFSQCHQTLRSPSLHHASSYSRAMTTLPIISRRRVLFNCLIPTHSCFIVSDLLKLGLFPLSGLGLSLFLKIYFIAL